MMRWTFFIMIFGRLRASRYAKAPSWFSPARGRFMSNPSEQLHCRVPTPAAGESGQKANKCSAAELVQPSAPRKAPPPSWCSQAPLRRGISGASRCGCGVRALAAASAVAAGATAVGAVAAPTAVAERGGAVAAPPAPGSACCGGAAAGPKATAAPAPGACGGAAATSTATAAPAPGACCACAAGTAIPAAVVASGACCGSATPPPSAPLDGPEGVPAPSWCSPGPR